MAHVGEATGSAASSAWRATVRGADGFFRAGQDAGGNWCLLDSAGERVFLRAVHHVAATPVREEVTLPNAAAQMRRWGVNAVGVGSDASPRDDGLPFLAAVEFCAAGPAIIAPGVRLPDVFQPAWPKLAAARAAEVCGPWVDARQLIGWVTDSHVEWGAATSAGRPSLLQVCLSLEPAFAAYHAAWEFVLALHGGRLEAVAQAWNARLANKEVVRELTRAEEGLGTRGYLRDDARWAREFARRYFTTTSAAIRAADPHHLVLGAHFRGPVGPAVLGECVYPAVDVALVDWLELPAALENPLQPVLADNVCWARADFLRGLNASPRQSTVELMLRKGRVMLERIARHPAVLGYAWMQWQDSPGEQPPFARGLLHANYAEAREHTEVLAAFNARAETLRPLHQG